MQVQVDAGLGQEVGRVRELHGRADDQRRGAACAHHEGPVAGRGDRAQARGRSCSREKRRGLEQSHRSEHSVREEVPLGALTCSPGPAVVGQSHRGRPLLGDGEQVCIGPIGQTWAGAQDTSTQQQLGKRTLKWQLQLR